MKKLNLLLALMVLCGAVVPTAVKAEDVGTAGSTGTSEAVLSAEAATFSVTVPTQLALAVKSDGTTEVGSANIINNSTGKVAVTGVTITAKNEWSLVGFDDDFKSTPVNTKKFGYQLNTIKTLTNGSYTFDAAQFTEMDAKNDTDTDQCALEFAAHVVPQTNGLTDEVVADVVFTVNWAGQAATGGDDMNDLPPSPGI